MFCRPTLVKLPRDGRSGSVRGQTLPIKTFRPTAWSSDMNTLFGFHARRIRQEARAAPIGYAVAAVRDAWAL